MQSDPNPDPGRIRFGDFQVDVRSHELLRAGRRVRLQEKSFLVLKELLKRPGQVATREELAAALWPKEYFVDAEHGLNTAVRKLREALGDAADRPRYIETLPKLGYRFLAQIEPEPLAPAAVESPVSVVLAAPLVAAPSRISARRRRVVLAASVGLAAALAAVVGMRFFAPGPEPVANASEAGPSHPVRELLSRARYLRDNKRYEEAKALVEKALELDPKNAEALGGLALWLVAQEGRQEEGREMALRAIELDPNAWYAHKALGNLARSQGDYGGAERHYRRAVEANPADAKTRNRLARHLLVRGRLDEARGQMLESRRLAPDDPDVQHIWIQYALYTGDYEGAIRQAKLWLAVWEGHIPEFNVGSVSELLGLAYVGARRPEEAIAVFEGNDLYAALALGYAGRLAEAQTHLARYMAESAADSAPEQLALAHIAVGDFDSAFACLDRAVTARAYPFYLHVPLFHAIHADPRWPAFAERLEREFPSGEQKPASLSREEPFAHSPATAPEAD